MSSVDVRPALRGTIYRGGEIVGGVVLSHADDPFIEEFNLEYAKLGLRVESQPARSAAACFSNEASMPFVHCHLELDS
ncbi:MAG: hypothetical protein GX575_11180 [Candidatus Anammoximicrobium sp.]|nr:hypothetical protein [Candidatus Anammoximicrobium sp.]